MSGSPLPSRHWSGDDASRDWRGEIIAFHTNGPKDWPICFPVIPRPGRRICRGTVLVWIPRPGRGMTACVNVSGGWYQSGAALRFVPFMRQGIDLEKIHARAVRQAEPLYQDGVPRPVTLDQVLTASCREPEAAFTVTPGA